METIKVNMNPNPLDVQTIHASQNDGEARQWEFELHNNGELIDTSDVKEQMVFKAYKGGTEQLLPENTSTPTTSPFKGDIRYPQGLLTDQEFTYRESPTESDGLAFVESIKGNTLAWNQLVQNGNFESTSGWTLSDSVSASASNNVLTATIGTTHHSSIRLANSNIPMQSGRKYLFCCDIKPTKNTTVRIQYGGVATDIISQVMNANVWGRYSSFASMTATNNLNFYYNIANSLTEGDIVQFRNCVLFDLTQMFGSGNEPTTIEEFTSLFPLPFYQFEQGKLLSFTGNGIKTVSKNQFNTQIVSPSTTVGTTLTKGDGSIRLQYTGTGRYTGFNFMNPNGGFVSDWANKLLLKKKYRLSFDFGGAEVAWTCGLRTASANSFVGSITMQTQGHYSLTLDLDTMTEDVYISWARTGNSTNPFDVTVSNIQLELGTTETSYTQYEEQTISLPISQYFPDGMDGVGTAYDELTNSGYAKRMGMVDMGTLNWSYVSTNTRFEAVMPSDYKIPTSANNRRNMKCSKYDTNNNPIMSEGNGISGYQNTNKVFCRDTSFSDANTFKQSLSGVYLCYELSTPLENYGVVDLGTLNWSSGSTAISGKNRLVATVNGIKLAEAQSSTGNILTNKYRTFTWNNSFNANVGDGIAVSSSAERIAIYDESLATATAEEFKSAMSGVYLLYEKQNPQGFTTASLVTENGETPLSNENGVLIGKCTEQLSSESGFFDAKIKLADGDGECYSNKLQLHIERSPQ